MSHDSKQFSGSVAAACFIAAIIILLGHCALKAQEPDFTYTVIDGKLISVVSTDTVSTSQWLPVTSVEYRDIDGAIVPIISIGDTASNGILKTARKIPWNNHAYFEKRTATKFMDWGDYLESWDKKQWSIWGWFAINGIIWGSREAYHADPKIFETRWGAGETSFWGSEAWKRNYWNNDPSAGHKPEWAGNFGRDFWHTSSYVSKSGFYTCSFLIGSRKQPLKYRVANLLIGIAVQSAFINLTYNGLR